MEGVAFIKKYFNTKKIPKPQWLRDNRAHYPCLTTIRKHLDMEALSSSEKEGKDPSEFGYSSDESSPPPHRVKNLKNAKVGVDASHRKDTELFGLDIKSVNVLERGIAPTDLGKNTTSFFLDQIGDMIAYPRHNHHKTFESLGDFIEAVTDLNNQSQMRKGGMKNSGWKHKSRNALESIKSGEDLNVALAYLIEEQHTILETFQGDLELVLIGDNADKDTATHMVRNSLAYRIGRDILQSYLNLLNHLAGVHINQE